MVGMPIQPHSGAKGMVHGDAGADSFVPGGTSYTGVRQPSDESLGYSLSPSGLLAGDGVRGFAIDGAGHNHRITMSLIPPVSAIT